MITFAPCSVGPVQAANGEGPYAVTAPEHVLSVHAGSRELQLEAYAVMCANFTRDDPKSRSR